MRPLTFFIPVLLLFAACQKQELPGNFTGQPVFVCEAKINGDSLKFQAGIGHYLHARHFQADSVTVYAGRFSAGDCGFENSCPRSLKFEIRAMQKTAEPNGDVGFLLQEQSLPFLTQATDSFSKFKCKFSPVGDSSFFASFFLDYGDGVAFDGLFSEHVYEGQNLPAEVTLRSRTASGFEVITKKTIHPETSIICPTVGFSVLKTGNGVLLSAEVLPPFGTGNEKFTWSNGSNETELFIDSSFAVGDYTVFYSDGQNCNASATAVNLNLAPLEMAAFGFNNTIAEIPPPEPEVLGRAVVEWIDNQGVVWRSDYFEQNDDARFIISNAENYDPNDLGEPTIKLRVNFDCRLFNNAGVSIPAFGEAIIAISYPK